MRRRGCAILPAMAPRFDADELRLELSVADLLERNLLRSLGFANRGGYERLWLGQAIHSRYQEQALAEDPSYQREVPLKATFPHRGWEVTVQGRADGLRRRPDGALVVEEIKSVRRGGRPAPAVREIYERQALLYAWMLRRAGEEKVAAELVLIEIGSESIEREPLELDFAVIDRSVLGRLNRLLRDFDARRAKVIQRRTVAAELAFPYPGLRPGQDEIVAEVEAALAQGEQLLVEAPTGLGKTVAALYPAIRYALAEEKRLFVLTAKTLQQEMASEVLALLNRDESFHTLRLRAKAKMCANDQLICHEEYCPYARDYYAKLLGTRLIQRLLTAETHLLPDAIFETARDAEVCPFEVSLELSHQSQVVVGDYNYAFEPYVALSDFAPDADLSDIILIVDEIHNLVERGRGYYSPELSAAQARAAADAMAAGGAPIHLRLAELGQRLAALIERAVEDGLEELGPQAQAAEALLPEDALWALRPEFDEAFVDYLEHRRETSSFRAEDPFVGLYFDLLRFLNGLVHSDGDEFSHCVQRAAPSSGGARLRILCKDPSRFLGRILGGAHAVIGLSATLSPGDFYRDLLGFDPDRARKISVPSPFPADNRQVVIDDTVATAWKKRPENYGPIARRLGEFAEAVPGNCLALFPSYQFLNEVAARLEVRKKRVLVQNPASSDRERESILESLRSLLAGDHLLLAVAGGVFAEGVDYPGEMLRAVAVVGPCLPAVSLERQLLKQYYQERFERGFEYAFVVPGMTRVVQAAGRLIRSAEDTGIIALFDQRFLQRPYVGHLPADWLDGGETAQLVGEPGRVAREFWAATRDAFREP